MNTAAHPVAPEEVMAYVDGELPAADVQTVGTHIALCAECADLAEKFRSTSLSLSRWKVEALPAKMDNSVTELASKNLSGPRSARANLFIRASFWTWRQWAAGLGATAAALALLVAIAVPNLLRSRIARGKSRTVVEQRAQNSDTALSDSGLTALEQKGLASSADRFSGIDSRRSSSGDRIVTPTKPGVAADSNGLFHGLGDHYESWLSADGQPTTVAPMIARTVSLSIVVKDFAASRASLDNILARHHGYSAQLNVSTPENAPRSLQASLRIPAPELSLAVSDLKGIGRVENESQSGEEVTQQHTDLVARLKNSRETEQRFRTILRQRAGNAVEVLQVEEGIARIRGDIERMEAEQKALEHRVDFANVELQLSEEYKAQLNAPAASVSTRIHNAFVAGYRNASETVLGIVVFFAEHGPSLVIWLLILLLPIVLVWRRYRRTLAAV